MTQLDELSATVTALAARVQLLEDHIAIAQLVSKYGPTVDSGSGDATADLWTEDGVFEVVGTMTMTGHADIAAMVTGKGQEALGQAGCAHVLTAPHINVDGDEARGWNYALHIRWDSEHARFWVARVSANTWHWRRTADGWRVLERVNANLDGADAPRRMLGGIVTDSGS